MKQTKSQIVTLLVFLGVGTISLCAEPFAKGLYLGQTPPGATAQVFAPGLICDTRPHQFETAGYISADGNTFCYRKLGYIYITENTDKGWTRPKRIRNIPHKTWSCCLSPDANTIYFLDQDYIREPRKQSDPPGHTYKRSTRNTQGWSIPTLLGPPLSPAWGGFSITTDNSVCFKSDRNVFSIAPFVDNTWGPAQKLPIEMGDLHACDPAIAPDKSFLVFYSIEPNGKNGTPTDLYLTLRLPDNTWTKPQRMGPGINTQYYEIAAKLSPDQKYMFFTRSTGWNLNPATDTADIYWVALKDYLPQSHR